MSFLVGCDQVARLLKHALVLEKVGDIPIRVKDQASTHLVICVADHQIEKSNVAEIEVMTASLGYLKARTATKACCWRNLGLYLVVVAPQLH